MDRLRNKRPRHKSSLGNDRKMNNPKCISDLFDREDAKHSIK